MVVITKQFFQLRLPRCPEDGGEVSVVRGAVIEVCDYAEDVGDERCENCEAVGEEETFVFVGVDVHGGGAENGCVY